MARGSTAAGRGSWRGRPPDPPLPPRLSPASAPGGGAGGGPPGRAGSWGGPWSLPMPPGPAGLGPLDAHIQREARYAATGRRTARARQRVPYAELRAGGYLPLVTSFWAIQDGSAAYDTLV